MKHNILLYKGYIGISFFVNSFGVLKHIEAEILVLLGFGVLYFNHSSWFWVPIFCLCPKRISFFRVYSKVGSRTLTSPFMPRLLLGLLFMGLRVNEFREAFGLRV